LPAPAWSARPTILPAEFTIAVPLIEELKINGRPKLVDQTRRFLNNCAEPMCEAGIGPSKTMKTWVRPWTAARSNRGEPASQFTNGNQEASLKENGSNRWFTWAR